MHTFCDINLWMSAIGQLGPIDNQSDLSDCAPMNLSVLKVAKRLAAGDTPLVMSRYSLTTLLRGLTNPTPGADGSTEFDPFDVQQARDSALTVGRMVEASGGFIADHNETEKGMRFAQNLIPAHLLGRGRGQVDFEDLMVLGACFAAVQRLLDAGYDEEDARVTLITADTGLLNCRTYLVTRGVCVISTEAYARAAA